MVRKAWMIVLALLLMSVVSSCSGSSNGSVSEGTNTQATNEGDVLGSENIETTEFAIENVSFSMPSFWETVIEENRMFSHDPDEENEDSAVGSIIEEDWSAGVYQTYEFRQEDSFTESLGYFDVEFEYVTISDGKIDALLATGRRNDTGEDYYTTTCMFPCSDHEAVIMTFGSFDKEKSYQICKGVIETVKVDGFDFTTMK